MVQSHSHSGSICLILCVCPIAIHLSHLAAVAQFGRFVSLGTVSVVTDKVRILILCRRYVVDERADLKSASDFVDLLTVDKLKGVVNTPWDLL